MESRKKLIKKMIKVMFALSLVFSAVFAAAYIIGLNTCNDIYSFLDLTVPFCVLNFVFAMGFGASNIEYEMIKNDQREKRTCYDTFKAENAAKSESKKIDRERRYIIKTYDRSGVHTKRINIRGNYGRLKSA